MGIDRRKFLRATGGTVAGGVLAGCPDGNGTETDRDRPYLDAEPNYRGWFDNVSNYEGTRDYRGESSVTIQVGVEGGIGYFKYGPPAIAVSAGTEVVWEWTGRGGAHNVVAEQGRFDSGDPVDADDETFTHTFDDPAIYRYLCEPHLSQNMLGAVFVGLG
ncbi:halocyanin domain-containing protein [Halosimplex salinum]|uniref:halocyanin domain-containing protein n=1 Tax=Halosimplex salinum TaxID=1710538 RepID=UPI000F46B46B|nr:halocyanin domain-containing protein [Halosimplex salinum]